ncbi:molybdate ABC transporter substrate-binding protein [Chelativorans salis]|uniref:Molybdate ABC transporter substrate-binding protein n=1 Tax=Chelativorans salis TaxID=2978478 RepID=A0ABT2LSL7_9HYPH|nr:molybdate ABC transporter substrate-binding protein [Chelativorans sp. EGI FJ00035]MCT7377531.1 molybdate ABC transporter substrate-binding protein [Chelativorans sp. EGI FJ00035]
MIKIVAAVLVALAGFLPYAVGASERLTIFAAASMKDAMDRVVPAFTAESGVEAVVSLAASSVLARQIEAGAPADVYVSADVEWMDWLAERGLVREASVKTVAGNALVIVSSAAADGGVADILAHGRVAMGDPSHVPAGRYARAALSHLGLWETVRERAVFAENVRVALELARRGEAAAAIVYVSDAQAVGLSPRYTFPPESHPPILYPAAATAKAKPGAEAFLDFLAGDTGQAIFRDLGFARPATMGADGPENRTGGR